MSYPDNPSRNGGVKTLAIRLEPELHAQLSLIAQLRSSTITDEIRTALEAHIVSVKAAPELAARADSVLAEIEREALARRQAIATLFGETPLPPSEAAPRPRGKQTGPRGDSEEGGS